MRVCFGTVLYQEAFKYIDDLLQSVNLQDYDDFEVVIINDNIDEGELAKALSKLKRKYFAVHFEEKYTPAELRIQLMLEAKKSGYDVLIIGDADDTFSADRISGIVRCRERNSSYSFFYNNIKDFSGNQMMPDMPSVTESIDDILSYNYLGMSNTSIMLDALSTDFINSLRECRHRVFDWYLYSRLLLEKKKGIFVPGAETYYRIHENNILGDQSGNPEKIEYEVSVKLQHYEALKDKSDAVEKLFECYREGKYEVCKDKPSTFWWGYTRAII